MVSILIPFYNREKYLEEALESIAKQTFRKWQVILYDDGSTDKGYEIAKKWLKSHNGFIIRGEKNKGVGHARNVLLDSFQTKYACWFDSDDWMHPDRLEKQFKFLENHEDVDMVFTFLRFCMAGVNHTCRSGVYTIDTSLYTSRRGLYNNMAFATAMFRKNVAMYKFPEKRRKEDVEWLTDLIGNVEFGVVEKALYHVRKHANRLTVPE